MGAFAAVRLPVDLTRKTGAEYTAFTVLTQFAGIRNVALEARATATFEMHFPGNLSNLVARLLRHGIPVGDRAEVSIPIKAFPGTSPAPPAEVTEHLLRGPDVWDVQFAVEPYVYEAAVSDALVTATILPSTNAMHQIYDALLSSRLLAQDVPTLPYIRGL